LVGSTGQLVSPAGHTVVSGGQAVSTGGQRVWASGHLVSAGGQRVSTTGHRVSREGHWVSTMGQRVSDSGHFVKAVGHLVSTAGHHVARTAVTVTRGITSWPNAGTTTHARHAAANHGRQGEILLVMAILLFPTRPSANARAAAHLPRAQPVRRR